MSFDRLRKFSGCVTEGVTSEAFKRNMAKWLPGDETKQLRFEFAQEIERLMAA